MVEYEFTLRDGTKVYEMVEQPADVHAFMRMHNAIAAKPAHSGHFHIHSMLASYDEG